MDLGDRIKYLREKTNWTQQQLCEKTRLTKVQLSRYETNDRKPDPEALKRIADALDTSVDYLLSRTDNPSPAVITSLYGGQAFLGGTDKYSEEELELAKTAAKAAIEAFRKTQQRKNRN